MRVVAFNGSPRESGATARGISAMLAGLEREGIETEAVHVGGAPVRGCMACGECRKLGRGCVIGGGGDLVAEARAKIIAADGVILGSPVYYGGIAGAFKCFLDRLFFPAPGLSYKVGASVASLRRSGGIAVFHQLNNYFNLAQMVITPSLYWGVIHGNSAEEAGRDLEGIQIMEAQGRNMAWLLKALAAGGREAPPPPPLPERKQTNFIR